MTLLSGSSKAPFFSQKTVGCGIPLGASHRRLAGRSTSTLSGYGGESNVFFRSVNKGENSIKIGFLGVCLRPGDETDTMHFFVSRLDFEKLGHGGIIYVTKPLTRSHQ